VRPLSVTDPVHQLNIMWYFHETLRRFICREMWSKSAFRENPLSDVTVEISPFHLHVKLSSDRVLLVCRSELYILPSCSNVFILVGFVCLCLVVPSCILYCLYWSLVIALHKANIQINKEKDKQGRPPIADKKRVKIWKFHKVQHKLFWYTGNRKLSVSRRRFLQ
jgi:hypothetical protein